MRALKTTLEKLAKKATIEDCVEMALAIFYRNFRDKILDLTANFPEDAKDKDGNAASDAGGHSEANAR